MIPTLRRILDLMRNGKTKPAKFCEYAQVQLGRPREPPDIDCPTRWYSTYIMVKDALELRRVLTSVFNDEVWNSPLSMSAADWENAKKLKEFLAVPADISTRMGTQKNVTMSLATLGLKGLIRHCKNYLDDDYNQDDPEAEKPVLMVCVENILQYCDKYEGLLYSKPARVAGFVRPQIPVQGTDRGNF
jgi:hypothetical protein